MVFVYEYTCALGDAVAPSLAAEGRALLAAITEDLARVPGVEVRTLIHVGRGPEESAFRSLARTADATLVIAPEFDELLATRCRWVLEEGGRLLGPTPDAVCLTADKLALTRHLGAHGIPTPLTYLCTDQPVELRYPVVFKPRHGAGSLTTVLMRDSGELQHCVAMLQRELPGDAAIVQPFVPGTPASVSFVIGPRQVVPLLPGAQHLSNDGRFRYQGGTIPLAPPLAERALNLGRRAVQAVPGLRGYVGVDLVLGLSPDGSGDQVIEINPRLTTSYLGLRALARTNLALAILRVLDGEELPSLPWRAGSVEITPDGQVTLREDS